MDFTRYNTLRRILIGIAIVFSVAFLSLSLVLLLSPTWDFIEIRELIELYENSDLLLMHDSFFILGIELLVFVGIPNFSIALLIIARMKQGLFIAIFSGIVSMFLFIYALTKLPFSYILIVLLVLSVLEIVLGLLCISEYFRCHFHFNPLDFNEIGSIHDTLVIYYAPSLYVRNHAYTLADRLGSELVEIKQNDDDLIYFDSDLNVYPKDKENRIIIDFKRYRNVHIVVPVRFQNIRKPIINFLSNYTIGSKRIYVEFVCFYTFFKNEYVKEIECFIPNVHTYIFSTVHFGVLQNRIKKVNVH